jgi:UDP-3-O-[3-hydroxymyristoyl] glucosamine N-acyltransferase
VGKGVILAGQVGAAGHLTIGDGAVATPQTGIANSVEPRAIVSGAPAVDHRLWLKTSVALSRLPELQRTVRRLTNQIKALEEIVKVTS